MALIDVPNRETCVVRRPRTNTPSQALVLLNDPTLVEAARVLAERVLRESDADPLARIEVMFRTLLARHPTDHELTIVGNALAKLVDRYHSDEEAARALVATGETEPAKDLNLTEVAALTSVAMLLLNLDETITKE